MIKPTDEQKLEEIYLVLSDLRYHLHKDNNTLADYEKLADNYCKRVAAAAAYAREMLPEELVERHDGK